MRKFIEKKSHTPWYLVKISHKKSWLAKSNTTHKPNTTNPFINKSIWLENGVWVFETSLYLEVEKFYETTIIFA